MKRTTTMRPLHFSRAFTLIELLITLAIIAALASVLLPSLTNAKASAHSAACKSTLRQIGVGLSIYLSEFGKYPLRYAQDMTGNLEVPGTEWDEVLLPYCGKSANDAVDSRPSGLRGSDLNITSGPLHCPFEPPHRTPEGWSRRAYVYNVSGTDSHGDSPAPPPTLGLGILGWPNVAVPETRVLSPAR